MSKITLLDGAFGTMLWEKAEKNGFSKEPVWKYNIDHPEIISELVKEYAEAGSEVVQANTFGANRQTVSRCPGYDVKEVIRAGVRITKEALQGTGKKCSLSVGPLSILLEPYGDMTEEECTEIYEEIVDAAMEEKPDLIVFETFMDVEMMKLAVKAAKRYDIPVFCSMTFEKVGKTMFGNSVEDVIGELEPLGISGIGLNCSLGPDLALPVIREFSEKTKLPLIFKPNAGKPVLKADGSTETVFSAADFAADLTAAFDYAAFVGGCCGSSPEFIREIRKRLEETGNA